MGALILEWHRMISLIPMIFFAHRPLRLFSLRTRDFRLLSLTCHFFHLSAPIFILIAGAAEPNFSLLQQSLSNSLVSLLRTTLSFETHHFPRRQIIVSSPRYSFSFSSAIISSLDQTFILTPPLFHFSLLSRKSHFLPSPKFVPLFGETKHH